MGVPEAGSFESDGYNQKPAIRIEASRVEIKIVLFIVTYSSIIIVNRNSILVSVTIFQKLNIDRILKSEIKQMNTTKGVLKKIMSFQISNGEFAFDPFSHKLDLIA